MSHIVNLVTSAKAFGTRDIFPLRVQRVENHDAAHLHTHEFHELVIIQKGTGLHVTEHGNYPLQSGHVFLIRGKTAHAYAQTRRVTLINILFRPRELGLPLHHLRDLPGYHALFRIEPRLRAAGRYSQRLRLTEKQLAEAMRHLAAVELELKESSAGYRFAACTHLMGLLGYLSRCYDHGRRPEQRSLMRLGEVLSYMENHPADAITVAELAARAHMSASTLTRRFRKVLGRSPIEHLIRLRIDRAMQLLQDPAMNITEIALACGFSDSNYFSRCFKAATGRSPRSYRKRNR